MMIRSIPDVEITVSPSMEDGPIIWMQTVTVACSWVPGEGRGCDITADGVSVWDHKLYGNILISEGLVVLQYSMLLLR